MNTVQSAVQAAPVQTVSVVETFHFRTFKDTPETRASALPQDADHEIVVDAGEDDNKVSTFKRQSEKHTLLVPDARALLPVDADNKTVVVLQDVLTGFMKAAARKLVDAGKSITPELLNWNDVLTAKYVALTTSGSGDTATYPAAILKELAELFTKWATAAGHKPTGVEVTSKMITGRFNVMSTAKWIPMLPKIVDNIGTFFTDGLDEQQQEQYTEVMEYLLKQAEVAMAPPKVEDMESMF